MTRRLPVVLAVLGALVLIASVISAMVVRSVDTATVGLPERPEASVLVTEPGVLSAVDPTVTVRASGEAEEPIVLAIGRTAEVEAWLADAEHARVVGLSSWEELSVEVATGAPAPDLPEDATEEPAEGEAEAAPEDAPQEPVEEETGLPNPAGSDLWVAEVDGAGEVELSWTDQPGQWSLVAATDGTGPAPMVELEWGRSVSTPWLVPGIVVGGLLLLAGAAMLVLDALARREQRQRDEAREHAALDWTPTGSGPLATIPLSVHDTDPGTGERLSRRQIREMERAVAETERRRRRGEVIPPIPQAGAAAADDVAEDTAEDWTVPAAEDAIAAATSAEDDARDEDTGDRADDPRTAVGAEDDTVGAQDAPTDTDTDTDDTAGADDAVVEESAGDHDATGELQDPAADPTTAADADEIPADGSTPQRPAPVAEPTGLRAWWRRRRGSAGAQGTEPADAAPAQAAPEPPGTNDSAPGGPQTPDSPTESRGWRSVWGFGSATPQEDRPTDDDTTDQGEEAR